MIFILRFPNQHLYELIAVTSTVKKVVKCSFETLALLWYTHGMMKWRESTVKTLDVTTDRRLLFILMISCLFIQE
jgi:hypothetical protein